MLSTSFSQYSEFISTNKLSNDRVGNDKLQLVGDKIRRAVEEYYASIGQSSKLNGFEWEFNLIDSDEINAWCMPGGKIVVYTGLFNVATTEEDLAVVIGHEVAHAVAQHGSERMSQILITNFGGAVLAEAVKKKPAEVQAFWMASYGVGTNLGYILPYSRTHEYEADYLGMVFMARAGYHPYYAVRFWDKMERYSSSGNTPEFLSTHPASSNRIKNLNARYEEVLAKHYKE